MSKRRYPFQGVDPDNKILARVRVRRTYHRYKPQEASPGDDVLRRTLLGTIFRGAFGASAEPTRAAIVLGVNRSTIFRWVRGERRLPGWLAEELHTKWSEIDRRRQAEIAAREREFAAIIEQERQLLADARRSLDRLLADDIAGPRPDSILLGSKGRWRARQAAAALRAVDAAGAPSASRSPTD